MIDFFQHYTTTDWLGVAIGLLLLSYGRKLYWLALGGIGFFLGLWLASGIFQTSSGLGLGLAFLVAILGAWLAIAVQKLAISIGGFAVGGTSGFWLAAQVLAPLRKFESDLWIWGIAAFGAVVGAMLASELFDAALIFLSSFVGAATIASRSHLEPPRDTWLFMLMLLMGLILQTRRADTDDDDED